MQCEALLRRVVNCTLPSPRSSPCHGKKKLDVATVEIGASSVPLELGPEQLILTLPPPLYAGDIRGLRIDVLSG
jgi:hypothetical protein